MCRVMCFFKSCGKLRGNVEFVKQMLLNVPRQTNHPTHQRNNPARNIINMTCVWSVLNRYQSFCRNRTKPGVGTFQTASASVYDTRN